MHASIKVGILVGAAGIALSTCSSTVCGICGPWYSPLVGCTAGYVAVRLARDSSRKTAASNGALVGLIAGGMVFLAQIGGSLALVAFVRYTGISLSLYGQPSTGPVGTAHLYSSIQQYLMFSLLGVLLTGLFGAGASYVFSRR